MIFFFQAEDGIRDDLVTGVQTCALPISFDFEFARTPKYKIEGKQDSFVTKKYRNKAGWMPYAEVLLGVYFFFTVLYAIFNENYATVPFLLLFVWGYLYTGFMSLGQTYFAHLRFGVNAPEMRPASSGAPGF